MCIFQLVFVNAKAGKYLSIASIIMIPLGLSQISSSILNAVGLELKSLKNYIISSAILIVCIIFLPKYIGTYSLIVGYFLMSVSSAIMNISMLTKRKLSSLDFLKTTIMLLVINIFSAALSYFIYNLLPLGLILKLIICAGISLLSNVLLMLCFNIANVKIIIFNRKSMHA